jgi:hypothetical protein
MTGFGSGPHGAVPLLREGFSAWSLRRIALFLRPAMRLAVRLLLPASCILMTACGKEPLYQEQGYVFGTLVEVTVYGESEPHAREAIASVMQEFQRLHDMLHAWKPSELSDLNKAIARGESRVVDFKTVAGPVQSGYRRTGAVVGFSCG